MVKIDRDIPVKNYFILVIILFVSFLVMHYFTLWYREYSEDRLSKPILNTKLFEIKYNELDNYVLENKKAVIYVSLVGDEDTRNFEESFINLIDNYNLIDNIVYFNLSEVYSDNKILGMLKDKYSFEDINFVYNTPCLLMFNDAKLIDIYLIKENNYSINRVENYLKVMDVIEVL